MVASPPRTPNAAVPLKISRRRLLLLSGGGAGLGYLGYRLLTRSGDFRINTVEKPTPRIAPEEFTLTVDGDVRNPLRFSLAELQALPAVSQISDFQCVEGWGVENVHWRGVRFQTLAELAGADPAAGFITFHSEGGVYKDSLSTRQALLPDVLVAYAMDDRPLTRDHGYPLRLVMPRMYGYKGPKWLNRIQFMRFQETGYWEQRGWRVDAWID